MTSFSSYLLLCAALSGLAPSVAAQAINLDIGRYNAEPSPSYGAAAGQAGIWNRMIVTGGGPLLDVTGAATTATVSASSAHHFTFGFDNPFTTGDDELLLDGCHDGLLDLTFSGLLDGDYFVYTYAFAPDNPTTFITDVEVPGSLDPIQPVGGTQWSGAHALGATYAKHRISVIGGSFHIVASIGNIYATVNGVQLEPTLALPVVYCTPKTNSLGCVPVIASSGTPSASSGSGFTVSSTQNRNDKAGLMLYGISGRASTPFQGATLCINAPISRSIALNSNGTSWPAVDCSGIYTIDVNAFAAGTLGGSPLPELSIAGSVVDTQFWGRDPGFAPPDGSSLSAGLEYTVGP
ncbi:MAG TPA: hypothetical protein VK843_13185 [Planctomycetota bacterium]|nr:hypothetical protein [Planctomycetota bacterium]